MKVKPLKGLKAIRFHGEQDEKVPEVCLRVCGLHMKVKEERGHQRDQTTTCFGTRFFGGTRKGANDKPKGLCTRVLA